MSTKVVCFRLLLIHRAIALGKWRKTMNANNMCHFCMHPMEIVKHPLWSGDFAVET